MKILLTIACGILACGASALAERPNILLIFADDIGYEALNSYGGQDFETPNLNRMAEEGLRFSRAYTSPVCTPSRVSLHTGLYVNRHGHDTVLPVHLGTDKAVDFQKMPTFAQQIRANGYQTSLTGKWQLATLQRHPDHLMKIPPSALSYDRSLWQLPPLGRQQEMRSDARLVHPEFLEKYWESQL